MVAQAEWRDYSMVGGRDSAEFAVFRRSGDAPAYRIEKRPALASKQGQWSITGSAGQVLKRGHELAATLDVLERKLLKVVR
jgi:hypothetical protein